jgi:4-diphosphocytidyl-2-C-methyl-D-erythritol kinase
MRIGGKINLFLRVTGRRPDGWHTLETLFLPLKNPADEVTVEFDASPGIELECDDPALPTAENNLVYRAAKLYATAAEAMPSWRIRVKKRIPVAAGLGGGSADAAATLRLLEAHYGALGATKLAAFAAELGADVPFFLDPRPAVGRGVGDELEYQQDGLPRLPLVLVNPGFPVRSKWAYRRFDESPAPEPRGSLSELVAALTTGDLEKISRNLRNDLAPALWRKFPLLSHIRAVLGELGALGTQVSGSGPTLFALMPDFVSARRAAAELTVKHPRWRVFGAEEI